MCMLFCYAPINVSTDYPPHGEGWGFEGDQQFILANAPAMGYFWVAIISILVCFFESSWLWKWANAPPLGHKSMANTGKSPMLLPIYPVREVVGDYIDSYISLLFIM